MLLLIDRTEDTNNLLGVGKSLLHAQTLLNLHFKRQGFEDERAKGVENPLYAFLPVYPLSHKASRDEVTPMLESLGLFGGTTAVAKCFLIVPGDPAICLDTGVYLLTVSDSQLQKQDLRRSTPVAGTLGGRHETTNPVRRSWSRDASA